MKFLKEEGALWKEPSGSSFMTRILDWPETSRDIFRVCWHLKGVKRAGGGVRVSPARDVLLATWLEMLINLEGLAEATIPLNDRHSGKIILVRERSKARAWKNHARSSLSLFNFWGM